MNGLLAICKKQDAPTESLSKLLNKGLSTLSHRGDKTGVSLILNKDFQTLGTTDSLARIAAGSCSSGNDGHNVASHEGNTLLFEGRLLNKEELCKQLSTGGENDLTDSEIVFRLFENNGTNCLKSLKGFWSLIYFDSKNKIIYCARDHIGNRPMYFCNSDSQFAAASESRTLYSTCEDSRSINKNTVIDYLLWGNIGRADQYFFNDIHSVEPSHFVKYETVTDKLTIEKYYTLPYNRSNVAFSYVSEQQYINKLRDLLSDSVRSNLDLFDGPVAVGVSGGMDSSALICTAKKTNPDKTLVAYTTTDKYDGGEAYWAEKVVRHTGVEWVKVVCTSDHIVEKLDTVNRVQNIPVYNASSIAQYCIMEEAKSRGQGVFLDGQGGDEMLGGYQTFYSLLLRSLRRNREWKNLRSELSQIENSGMTKKDIFTRILKEWAKAHYYTPQVLARKKRKYQFESLMPQARDNYFNEPSPIPEMNKEVLNDALYESYTIFLGNILRWGEHSAASHGIECVIPLSDYIELSEFAFSVPSSFKIHDGWNKYLLRKAMVGTVPDEICWRKQKMGFYIPEQKWLNEIGTTMFETIKKLDDPEDCINKKYILENFRSLFSTKNPLYQQFIFRCYSYLLWRNGLPD